ncbi:hypothetical protein [Pedobacter deserti]|uniref:hypothetical protein n=1 Tax=Pedobacter deserti TaxID=2817382 RepID=UPI00210EF24C|nr:hypothetical protein [Pedobacter sp. SYSU D00382]
MKKIFIKRYARLSAVFSLVLATTAVSTDVRAQGCVAIRSTGGICAMTEHPDEELGSSGGWVFNANNRYFKSNKHYKGSDYQEERIELGTEVINYQYALDLALTRLFNSRWSMMIDVPILANKRTSLYEHNRVSRHAMHSYGLGDIRIAGYRWLLDPAKNRKGNIQLGLGLKLPTGDYKYQDYWHNVGPGDTKELRTVDQSIQLGDGGLGITAEVNTYYNLAPHFGLYGNLYYLSNPRGQNGVRTYRELVSSTLYNETIMSVPDQYMARAGVNYAAGSLVATAGARIEGIPVRDLIGGSGDFRRPGYIWSVEPGLTYQFKRAAIYATVPVALYRNRTRSVTDIERSTPTARAHGDAAFADYSINAGISFKL